MNSSNMKPGHPPSDVKVITPMKAGPSEKVDASTLQAPYSVYTKYEKWFIVILIAFAGLFSPLTANIYFPAIPTLVQVFHKSTELINLTVTMYMVLQGIAPMVWGTLSDYYGRRPIFAACLLVLSLSCVGLALVPTSAYWLLMVLRCVQAAGSASTIALGAGVIGDIATPEERGGFFGLSTLGPMIGPTIGPVIGGALADRLGWRAIFWFLCIASSGCLVVIILFLPETLRSLVGNGGVVPAPIYRPLIPIVGRNRHSTGCAPIPERKTYRNPLRLLGQLDIAILLAVNAVICAVFYGVLASISSLYSETYTFLNETTLGLCFLAIGGGMTVGSAINGKLLDWDYRKTKRRILEEAATDSEKQVLSGPESGAVMNNFPIESARLRMLPFLVIFSTACCIGYGWCLVKKVNIAGPLILQIGVGYVAIAVMNSTQTLMVDLVPTQGSSVTACNNLVRCTFSAVIVSVMDLIIRGVGAGWTYVILGGLNLLAIPLLYWVIRVGPRYRARRREIAQAQSS